MVLLIVLVIIWTSSVVTQLFRAQHARTPNPDGPAWSALDDRQLTRLLTDSAPQTTTD